MCSDADFAFLLELTYVLLAHAMTVHDMLPSEEDFAQEDDEQATAADELLEALPKQFGRAEAVAEGEKMGLGSRTVDRRIKQWVGKKQIVRLSAGHFMKI